MVPGRFRGFLVTVDVMRIGRIGCNGYWRCRRVQFLGGGCRIGTRAGGLRHIFDIEILGRTIPNPTVILRFSGLFGHDPSPNANATSTYTVQRTEHSV